MVRCCLGYIIKSVLLLFQSQIIMTKLSHQGAKYLEHYNIFGKLIDQQNIFIIDVPVLIPTVQSCHIRLSERFLFNNIQNVPKSFKCKEDIL